ncbi:hypothetical protein AOL_s00091g40 [Orbilia oligospora ATCC 24927]|uniref:DNA/RNA-binding domain-containing protein n=1 Tax=Arthrobotrys oligospora (strain ATCC 24927 / CBS 115.81 / DSM 1491) TaxID=756982 RepID=G1XHY8_ARTOA|nr:hypothetical protein AOL_s00091g40 [Orbilia oligospora ATCC 24927]EGX47219.1 hypothetical protein AOL_s00091g40 [Orbilia oligospora ATCC 24927]
MHKEGKLAPSTTLAAVARPSGQSHSTVCSAKPSAQIPSQPAPIPMVSADETSIVQARDSIPSPATVHTTTQSPPPSSISISSPTTPPSSDIIRQLDTAPLLPEDVATEAKGIYDGIVMLEAKCIELVPEKAAAAIDSKPLTDEECQSLITLHKTLLGEYHDFLWASQHHVATLSVNKLATKHNMPNRMCLHGVYNILELFRSHKLEDSERISSFLSYAYSMMALLYETKPVFADTWIECLGYLARYHMAIQSDPRDRNTWMDSSRSWYSKGAYRQPHIGSFYHYLAVVSRLDTLQQLFFYYKALAVTQPFSAARESILTLFADIASQEVQLDHDVFISLHSICFTSVNQNTFDKKKDEYLGLLKTSIPINKPKFKASGAYIAICGVASLFQYNLENGSMQVATTSEENQHTTADADADAADNEPKDALLFRPSELNSDTLNISLICTQELAFDILSLLFSCEGNGVQPHIHVWLVFLDYLKYYPNGIALIFKRFPWKQMTQYGTALLKEKKSNKAFLERVQDSKSFPTVEGLQPLPEEYMMRGLEIAGKYFPGDYFSGVTDNDETESFVEPPQIDAAREEKILWLMVRVASYYPWVRFDPVEYDFSILNKW